MQCEEVRVQFGHRLEGGVEASHGGVWGGKHFRQLKQRGKIPETNTGSSMFKGHQGSHCVFNQNDWKGTEQEDERWDGGRQTVKRHCTQLKGFWPLPWVKADWGAENWGRTQSDTTFWVKFPGWGGGKSEVWRPVRKLLQQSRRKMMGT